MIPVLWVEVAGFSLLGIIIVSLIFVLRKWHKSSIPCQLVRAVLKMRTLEIMRVLSRTIIFDGLLICPLWRKSRGRWLAHALVYYGFLGLVLTTTLNSIFNPAAYPLSLTNPIKILGNVSGVILLIGVPFVIKYGRENSLPGLGVADATFMPALVLTVISGFITETFSFAENVTASHTAYIVHLALAVVLLGSAPFTRFVHAILAPYLILYDNYKLELGNRGSIADYKQELITKQLKSFIEKEKVS